MAVTLDSVTAAFKTLSRNPAAAATSTPSDGPDFAGMVKQAAAETVGQLKAGEAASTLGLAGKLDLSQVVTAVSNAEVTLQAAVAVRDKVVQSYLEILRMPI